MIVEFLLSGLVSLPMVLLKIIPSIPSLEIPSNVYSGISEILSFVGYVLPVKALLPIIVIFFTMGVSKIVVAIVIRVKSFIPTMGA